MYNTSRGLRRCGSDTQNLSVCVCVCVCVRAVSKRWILSLNFEDFAKGKEDGVQNDCDKG